MRPQAKEKEHDNGRVGMNGRDDGGEGRQRRLEPNITYIAVFNGADAQLQAALHGSGSISMGTNVGASMPSFLHDGCDFTCGELHTQRGQSSDEEESSRHKCTSATYIPRAFFQENNGSATKGYGDGGDCASEHARSGRQGRVRSTWRLTRRSVGDDTPPEAMILMWCAPWRSSSRAAIRTWSTPSHTRPSASGAQPQGSRSSPRSRMSPCPPVCDRALPQNRTRGPRIVPSSTACSRAPQPGHGQELVDPCLSRTPEDRLEKSRL